MYQYPPFRIHPPAVPTLAPSPVLSCRTLFRLSFPLRFSLFFFCTLPSLLFFTISSVLSLYSRFSLSLPVVRCLLLSTPFFSPPLGPFPFRFYAQAFYSPHDRHESSTSPIHPPPFARSRRLSICSRLRIIYCVGRRKLSACRRRRLASPGVDESTLAPASCLSTKKASPSSR